MNFNEIMWHSVFRLQISACPKHPCPLLRTSKMGVLRRSLSRTSVVAGWPQWRMPMCVWGPRQRVIREKKSARGCLWDGSGFFFRLWNVSNLASLKGDEGVVDTSGEYTSSRKIWQKHPRFKDWSKGLKRLKSDAVSLIISRPPSVVSYL